MALMCSSMSLSLEFVGSGAKFRASVLIAAARCRVIRAAFKLRPRIGTWTLRIFYAVGGRET